MSYCNDELHPLPFDPERQHQHFLTDYLLDLC